MKTLNRFLVCSLILGSLVGCGSQARNTAARSLREAQRIQNEVSYDLYQIVVRKVLSSVKTRIRLEHDKLDTKVTVVDRSGKIYQLTLLDKIINEEVQALVDAAKLYRDQAIAEGLSDHTLVYVLSQESFIEVLVRDIKAVLSGSEQPDGKTEYLNGKLDSIGSAIKAATTSVSTQPG